MTGDLPACVHTCAFQSPVKQHFRLFARVNRHSVSQVLKFLGETEGNKGNNHISTTPRKTSMCT